MKELTEAGIVRKSSPAKSGGKGTYVVQFPRESAHSIKALTLDESASAGERFSRSGALSGALSAETTHSPPLVSPPYDPPLMIPPPCSTPKDYSQTKEPERKNAISEEPLFEGVERDYQKLAKDPKEVEKLVGPDTLQLLEDWKGKETIGSIHLFWTGELIEKHGSEQVNRAILICMEANVTNWNYLRKVIVGGAERIPGTKGTQKKYRLPERGRDAQDAAGAPRAPAGAPGEAQKRRSPKKGPTVPGIEEVPF